MLEPGLYLAATPIGNLGDITLRVLEALAAANMIACEDTRVTGRLLQHYSIKTPMTAYHEHNADSAGNKILEKIIEGQSVVLTSDAGTPVISDPGFRLVVDARSRELPVIPLPGASAPLAALIASGIPSQQWTFHGFLPSKQGARQAHLKLLSSRKESLIFFDSPNRLVNTLNDISEIFGQDRIVCVARELTKLHEEVITAPVSELVKRFARQKTKGEIVIIVSPSQEDKIHDPTVLISELLETMTVKQAAAEAAELTGMPKRQLYQLALTIKGEQ